MKNLMTRLFKEEEGQGMVEYGILIAAIAAVVALTAFLLGGKIRDMFQEIADKIDGLEAVKEKK